MNRTRHKGRFAKKNVINKRKNAVQGMKYAKEAAAAINNESETEDEELQDQPVCAGRRIVELTELSKNLFCCKCAHGLLLTDIVNEKRLGLNSILQIRCQNCSIMTSVPTGKLRPGSKKQGELSDVNTKAVLGAVHAGLGCTALNKLLACLNIPSISGDLFKRYERQLGHAIEEAARESCKRAAEEERRLVLENIEKLCEELPEEIAREIYANIEPPIAHPPEDTEYNLSAPSCSANLFPGTNPSHTYIDLTSKVGVQRFDKALGNIVNIIVSYDMGWSKRGNGRSYDSLNGYGAIMGFLTGKILDYRTRNRKCRKCDRGHPKSDHDCRKNFRGSAKAMEPDVAAELVHKSSILDGAGLKVRVLIGDEDSSTMASVRRGSSERIFKLADKNHLRKHFTNELYELQKFHREMKNRDVIPHLQKCFTFAVAQNRGKSADLAAVLRTIPDHVFGQHENCGTWCQRNSEDRQQIMLQSPELHRALTNVFYKYANSSEKFSVAASSQGNECLNGIMAHKAPKNRCYSTSEAADFRYASAVCTKNDGERYLIDITKKQCASPGKYTESFTEKLDKIKKRRADISKLPATKSRRNRLKRLREDLRKKTEQNEGIQYQPNCGIEVDFEAVDDVEMDNNIEEEIPISPASCKIVYFDLESSGFGKSADILQIAAKSEGRTFSVYVNPTQSIASGASLVTGLENRNGELYCHGTRVQSIPLQEALKQFLHFLDFPPKPSLLVAHNARFDTILLIQGLKRTRMIHNFKSTIAGFSDTLLLLGKQFPDRKGKGQFKLSTLALDFLGKNSTEQFHEASYDVEILEELVSKFISPTQLFEGRKSYAKVLNEDRQAGKIGLIALTLQPLNGTISDTMIKKIANAGLAYSDLEDVFAQSGAAGLQGLLSEKQDNNKPRVTKTARILDSIIAFFEANRK